MGFGFDPQDYPGMWGGGEITLYESQNAEALVDSEEWLHTLCGSAHVQGDENTPRVSVGIVVNKDTHVNLNNKNDCVFGTQFPYAHIPENWEAGKIE